MAARRVSLHEALVVLVCAALLAWHAELALAASVACLHPRLEHTSVRLGHWNAAGYRVVLVKLCCAAVHAA